ncbi:MAG: PcfJ domain-containing protein [Deltaproteobacteria bacterium]|nr:PcfJ domain-containing protein [Deltaproteobacteria bacterium]
MLGPAITIHDQAVEVRRGGAVVVVDASRHRLVVRTAAYGDVELGASRAGVAAAAGIALAELGLESGERDVVDALCAALKRAATRALHGCPVDVFAQHGLHWNPVVWSAEFLAARWLVDDVERFLPCRVALAHVEGDDDEATLSASAALVDRMLDWRRLFSFGGEQPSKALKKTLGEFGDGASPFALWGLRNVPLTRRATSAVHVEVLGSLGQLWHSARLTPHMQLVERSSVVDVNAGLAAVPRDAMGLPTSVAPAHALAELIARLHFTDGEGMTLARLITAAARSLGALSSLEKTALPPIPLPSSSEVRFLSTVDEVRSEGKIMGHCVGSRADLAVRGEAFLFHVDTDDGPATVQVDPNGVVVEARGPSNRQGDESLEATMILAAWGRGFPGGGSGSSTGDSVRRLLGFRVARAMTMLEAKKEALANVDVAEALDDVVSGFKATALGRLFKPFQDPDPD